MNYDTAVLRFSAYKELIEKVSNDINLEKGDSVLDLGCGTGNLENRVKSNPLEFSFEGLDNSPVMLNIAKRKLKNDSRFKFSLGDINEDFKFENETFSKVVMLHSLYAVEDLNSTLQNIARVLKPGGELHIVNPLKNADRSQMVKYELNRSGLFLFILKLLITLPAQIVNSLISKRVKKGYYHFLSNEEYIILLEKNGFSVELTSLVYANQSTYIISKLSK